MNGNGILNRQSRAEQAIIILGVAAMIGVWVSFLVLGFFSQPGSDDFCNAAIAKDLGSFSSIVKGYLGWTGRYTSLSLQRFFPSVFSLTTSYWIGPVCIYLLLSYVMIFTLKRVLTIISGGSILFLTLIIVVLYMTHMPKLYEGLYWISGSFTYQLGNILLLFLAGLVSAYYRNQNQKSQIIVAALACINAAFAVGTNEVTLVIVIFVCLVGLGISVVKHSPHKRFWLALVAVATFFAILSITAPGNSVRSNDYPNSHRFLWAIFHSVVGGGQTIISWSSTLSLWAGSVLIVPAILQEWKQLEEKMECRIWHISIPLIWIGILFVLFFPVYYATGEAPAKRVLNAIYLFFLIGWFTSLSCIIALLRPQMLQGLSNRGLIYTGAIVAFTLGILSATNSDYVMKDLRRIDKLSGFINNRYSLIEESKALGLTSLVVPRIRYWPYALWEDDLKEDPDHWQNKCQADFFGLESLAVERRSEFE